MQFRINHSQVIRQANSIAGDAAELSGQIKLLDQLEQDCKSVWKGEAADTFIAKLRVLRDEMSRTQKQMSNLASTIKECANRIQREDEAAAERAADLSRGGCGGR